MGKNVSVVQVEEAAGVVVPVMMEKFEARHRDPPLTYRHMALDRLVTVGHLFALQRKDGL